MALVFFKNLILPHNKQQQSIETGERQGLLSVNDLERQTSPLNTAGFSSDKEISSGNGGIALLRCRVNPRIISDATIGLSDGLTVPFALTAGLSALGTTQLVIYAGFAELVAGAISMGLGGYLGAKGEADGYFAALAETKKVVHDDKAKLCEMVRTTFDDYGLRGETVALVAEDLRVAGSEKMVDFLMRFQHRLAETDFKADRPYVSGLTIAMGYFMGGLLPLLPYLFFEQIDAALYCSVLVMAIALFVFGWVKTMLVGECGRWVCFLNAVQMLVLGGLAAGSAMGCVKAIGG